MSGILGSAYLVAGQVTLLCTLDRAMTINIRAANASTQINGYTCWIGSDSTPGNKDKITPNVQMDPLSPYEDSGFICSTGEKVWCMAANAGVSVRVHGAG